MVPADQGPDQVEATAGAASASTRSGVANRSFKKSATHIGATRASSTRSRRLTRQTASPRRPSCHQSPAERGLSGGGGSASTGPTSLAIRSRKAR